MLEKIHTLRAVKVRLNSSAYDFCSVSPDVQPKLEYSYSVFVLDDDADGGNEWEPETSEPGDLVCPIASSEFTSLEPVGKSFSTQWEVFRLFGRSQPNGCKQSPY